MTNDARVREMRDVLERLLPELEIPGLFVEALGFDFIRQSFTVSLARGERRFTLLIPAERLPVLERPSRFDIKHLRQEIESGLAA